MLKHIILPFIILIICLVNYQCAQIEPISGGERDTIPPVLIHSDPDNKAVNFSENNFVLEFDEYFNVKSINQKLVVSPPLEEKPEVLVRGKKVIVNINNELKDSVTYNFNFADAIQDLHENNPIPDFQFVFSTGPKIDSLKLKGEVLNAFDHKPVEGVHVMIYAQFNDSTPIKKLPDYFSITDKNGVFAINNVKKDTYHLFALKDLNKNLLFDMQGEQIGFLDTTITPKAVSTTITDTIKIRRNDTTEVDSIMSRTKTAYFPDSFPVYLFQEEVYNQYLSDYGRPEKWKCRLIFNEPVTDSLTIRVGDTSDFDNNVIITEKNVSSDSITCWIKDSLYYFKDTVRLFVSYTRKDSMNHFYVDTDTLSMTIQKKEKKKGKRLKRDKTDLPEEKTDSLPQKLYAYPVGINVKDQSTVNYTKRMIIEPEYPVKSIDTNRIGVFIKENDSVRSPVEFRLVKDSLSIRKYELDFQKNHDKSYIVEIKDSAMTDIYNQMNDSVYVNFKTQREDYYGSLEFTFKGLDTTAVIQRLNTEEKVLDEYYSSPADSALTISYLPPEKFSFKLFLDRNKNKKWDTGKYPERIQPEKVYYYPEDITIKSKFKTELTWEIE